MEKTILKQGKRAGKVMKAKIKDYDNLSGYL
jgi:hypothetical protein